MLFLAFLVSGVIVGLLLILKAIELKTGRSTILRLISKGDERLRRFSQDAAEMYSERKETLVFFTKNQLPLRARNIYYKALGMVRDKVGEYIGDMRNSRFIKKSDGISEFLKSVSETEKGGEINDTLEAPSYDETKDRV